MGERYVSCGVANQEEPGRRASEVGVFFLHSWLGTHAYTNRDTYKYSAVKKSHTQMIQIIKLI